MILRFLSQFLLAWVHQTFWNIYLFATDWWLFIFQSDLNAIFIVTCTHDSAASCFFKFVSSEKTKKTDIIVVMCSFTLTWVHGHICEYISAWVSLGISHYVRLAYDIYALLIVFVVYLNLNVFVIVHTSSYTTSPVGWMLWSNS